MDHKSNQLSGGQQQRVAIARALVTDPPLLLADEPTGNLDTRTSLEVLALLQKLNRERGITIVLVTHERDIAACASRVITMRDGRIVSDESQDAPLDAAQELGRLPAQGDGGAADDSAGTQGSQVSDRGIGGPIPFSVYPMMRLGGFAGEAAALVYLLAILHVTVWRGIWFVLLLGELGKAWAGGWWARRKQGYPLTPDQRARIALYYSFSLSGPLLVSLPFIAAWRKWGSLVPSDGWFQHLHGAGRAGATLLLVASVIGLAGLLRYLLLTLFNPRR
jgi:ABC transporter